jgi:cation/acetate symporter
MKPIQRLFGLGAWLAPAIAIAAEAVGGPVEQRSLNYTAIMMFIAIVALTLGITYWAARRTRSANDFFAAGGGITAAQNGFALAGDYMSAAALLGGTGLVYISGFDSLIFSIGATLGWPLMLFLIAERLRNLGKYTFADVVSFRLEPRKSRTIAATGGLVVVTLYLIAQMVGAGKLIQLLFGMPYLTALIIVGALMIIYVTFGGMLATTWVQITKAGLMLFTVTLLLFLVLRMTNFSIDKLISDAVSLHARKGAMLLPGPATAAGNPLDTLSLGVGLVFGLMGLPHILMRFFTVPDAKVARKSAFYATILLGYFFTMVTIIGLASVVIVSTSPEFQGADGKILGGSNMAALHVAKALGGDWLLGLMSAVAFATILAVVSGLTLAGASAVSHDLYASIVRRGRATDKEEVRVSRIATVALGIIAIALATLFENFNITVIFAIALGAAASVNFPILFLAMFWKGLTSRGALIGGLIGLFATLAFIVLGPTVWVGVLHHSAPIFPYANPALFAMTLSFFAIFLASALDRSDEGNAERARFEAQFVRAMTGIGAAGASQH